MQVQAVEVVSTGNATASRRLLETTSNQLMGNVSDCVELWAQWLNDYPADGFCQGRRREDYAGCLNRQPFSNGHFSRRPYDCGHIVSSILGQLHVKAFDAGRQLFGTLGVCLGLGGLSRGGYLGSLFGPLSVLFPTHANRLRE